MLLGRLVGVEGHCIALAPDLQENLANADQASEDFKHGVDEFVRRTGMDVPEPEPDPVDEVRSDAGRQAPATLDLQAAGITTVIWATGMALTIAGSTCRCSMTMGFRCSSVASPGFPGSISWA